MPKAAGSMTGKEEFAIPVVSVRAVDPTGAGDAYRAGFLLALTRGYSISTCGKIGSTVASFAVADTGLPDRPSNLGRNESPL